MDREYEATFDSQGHFDIPIEVRQRHGLTNGSRVKIEERKNEVVLKPVIDENERKRIALAAIDKAVGFLGTDGRMLRDLMDDRKSERERDDRAFGSR
jgi:bifunctional DNA-binding transcriptional regulator/antitoxin component of YhaV-PrlF toxin-antitoxin module